MQRKRQEAGKRGRERTSENERERERERPVSLTQLRKYVLEFDSALEIIFPWSSYHRVITLIALSRQVLAGEGD
eukprot:2171462-Rhodomonas_salina.3